MPVVDLLELPSAVKPNSPLAGLDLGEKTIGVAVSDTTWTIASPLELIRKTRFTEDAERLFALMASRDAIRANSRSASSVNLVLRISSSGLAMVQVVSETATPIVFSPRSSPASGEFGFTADGSSSRSTTGISSRGVRASSVQDKRSDRSRPLSNRAPGGKPLRRS